MMKFETHTEKVSGSSFYKHDMNQFQLKGKRVPSAIFQGIILPEPTNPYDTNAKMVNVLVPNNVGGYDMVKVGYLKKDGWLYNRVKVCRHKAINCEIKIQDYSELHKNNSYTIMVG